MIRLATLCLSLLATATFALAAEPIRIGHYASLTGKDAAEIGLALKSYPAAELETEGMRLADRMGLVDPHLLSANKRLVNLGLELMGARTLQRIGAEIDARGHLAPMAMAFKATMPQTTKNC